jgi:hypothetical protein
MTRDEQTIIELIRRNTKLRDERDRLREEIAYLEIEMRRSAFALMKAGIPYGHGDANGFEPYTVWQQIELICRRVGANGQE